MVVFDFVRHAQGYHNLSADNLNMPDPNLTPLGEEQCADLRRRYAHHDRVRLFVASPLRRTLRTCLLAFGPEAAAAATAAAAAEAVAPAAPTYPENLRVVALPELQEVSSLPSDVGSAPAVLHTEFAAEPVDLSRVQHGWNHKGLGSPYECTIDKLEARGRAARRNLRALAAGLDADDRVVVVSHGGFLHFLTEDYDGIAPSRGTSWKNAECRSFEFVDPTGADEDARLRETDASRQARRGTATGLTQAEQLELRAVYYEFLMEEVEKVAREGVAVQFESDYATTVGQREVEAQRA
ncbi:phosphoglycerate mutase [Niveomyces insectorum RCEF 264]|uniref:Phosphoglycerate mutase n=1 Tax=Niveomyces insectorum RCEF 264 TaxID=1081102 RepID=A0A167TZE3_9HYPO|nr:phosphoglycerate mutase [Niveomyces insectorum RCEF 264]